MNPGFLRVLVAHRTWCGIQLLALNGEQFWHLEWEDVRGTKATQQTGEQRVKVHNHNVNPGEADSHGDGRVGKKQAVPLSSSISE